MSFALFFVGRVREKVQATDLLDLYGKKSPLIAKKRTESELINNVELRGKVLPALHCPCSIHKTRHQNLPYPFLRPVEKGKHLYDYIRRATLWLIRIKTATSSAGEIVVEEKGGYYLIKLNLWKKIKNSIIHFKGFIWS